MLPSLRAEESLLAVTRTAVGSGVLRRGDADGVMRDWDREARAMAPARAVVRNREALPSIGIGVRRARRAAP